MNFDTILIDVYTNHLKASVNKSIDLWVVIYYLPGEGGCMNLNHEP